MPSAQLSALDRATDWSAVQLLDCTLRDGSYAVDFQFDERFVQHLLARLGQTPVSLVEVGHGIGLEAESAGIKAGNIGHHRWSELAAEALPGKAWGMFAQPEFTRLDTVAQMTAAGMSFLRIGMEPGKVAANLDYLRRAVELCGPGCAVYLNLMKSSATPVDQFVALLDEVPDALAGVYVVDSYGAMLPEDVERYVTAVRRRFDVVGFHGHDNLGMANINSMTALVSGATVVDGTLNGIGRGAGNASIESLASVIKLLDADRFDYQELASLAEFCRANMKVIAEDRSLHVLGGVIGVHSGLFPLVERLAEQYDLTPARLMETAVELAEQTPGKADFELAADTLSDASNLTPAAFVDRAAAPA